MHTIQPTPISDKQFVKLMEMCDFLFPDYAFFGKSPTVNNPFYINYRHVKTKKDGAISWFELCTLDIPIRLCEQTGKAWESILEVWLYSQTEHLVDYLYDIYDNLK